MNEEQQQPEPAGDDEPRRPQRIIRGAVLRKSREELAERGVVIP